MPFAYLQWRFHSGERVVVRGPLVFIIIIIIIIVQQIAYLVVNFIKAS